ncbi:unnamed protein product [Ectocarpus sp. 12 AP-2014]
MARKRMRVMSPQALLFVVAIAVAAFSVFAEAFKDPHNKFCGEDECYAVLGLQRGADKADIKKAYRTISLDVHPDKNPTPAAKEKFTKVAKAYGVFMDEELNKKYHFFLDHPDAYWLEYGHHWVMRYASASDVRGVLLGLLVLVSFFAYGIQHTRYTTAVRYLRKAAEKNLGPKSGGNAATMQLRREAEALLAERKGEAQGGKKNGVGSKAGGKVVKQSRKEKEAELAEVIAELSLQVEIKGSCRKPTWRDQPVVLLAMLPVHTATYLWHKFQLVASKLTKREVTASEREYWVRRSVGRSTWDDLDAETRAAATEGDAWRGGQAMEDWKEVYLYGGGATSSSKGLRKRNKVASGSMMKGVLGEGPEVEY